MVALKEIQKLNRLSVAMLKQLVPNQELVEWFDVSSTDPTYSYFVLKACKILPRAYPLVSRENTLLQSVVVKATYELPDYIKSTGIMELRSYTRDKGRNIPSQIPNP
jgi:splicing factor 3B subunit 2